jgi:hypothetical protein
MCFQILSATIVAHYPWFTTFNYLYTTFPKYDKKNQLGMFLVRNALIGFSSSIISDICSNSLRVLKTFRQTNDQIISYSSIVRVILKKEGIKGILGRGLSMPIFTNATQGILFSVLWRYFESK